MSDLSTLPKGDSAWLLRKAIERIMQQVSVLETNIGSSTTGNSLDGQIIFNDNGTLRGDTGLTYAKSTTTLRAGLLIVPGNTQLATVGILYVGTTANPKLKVDVGANLTTITNATITGDLTVRTTGLVVNATGVGIGSATTGSKFYLYDAGAVSAQISSALAGGSNLLLTANATGGEMNMVNGLVLLFKTGNTERYRIGSDGTATWSVGGSTAMTLNSTGLGVGVSPSAGRLHIKGGSFQNPLVLDTLGYNQIVLQVNGVNRGQIYADATNCFAVVDAANNNTRFVVTDSGNVGVGVTPSAWGNQYRALQIFSNSSLYGANSYGYYGLLFNGYNDNTDIKAISSLYVGEYRYELSTGAHKWFGTTASATAGNTAVPTQAMTLDASGNLLVGTTTAQANAGGLKLSNVAGNLGQIAFSNNSGSADYVARFNWGSTPTLVGNITVSSGGTAFNTTSDYRLKESVQPIVGGLARVNALKPSIYKWKADGSNGEGFIAHELAAVVPAAVTGEKDAVNEDGSIKPQGVDMSRVVPILVAAIQELTARVQTLESR